VIAQFMYKRAFDWGKQCHHEGQSCIPGGS
jgi:hypothetical protein